MAVAVHFDNELCRRAVKVGRAEIERMLVAEFETTGPLAEQLPEQALGKGGVTP
jgi:hypothetical protein